MTKKHQERITNPPIDSIIQETAELLSPYGVTETLINTHWKNRPKVSFDYYKDVHKDPKYKQNIFFGRYAEGALEFFVSGGSSRSNRVLFKNADRKAPVPPNPPLSPEAALDEISGLNDPELDALVLFYPKLRGHHLRDWRTDNGFYFDSGHNAALKVFIWIEGRSIEEAMRLLKNSTHIQSKNNQRFETLACTPELKAVGYYRPKVLDRMRCPISLMIMDDPVYIGDFPHAFEQSWLLKWFERKPTNPCTGEPANPKDIRPADSLKGEITRFLELQTERKRLHEQYLQQSKQRNEPKPYLNQYLRFIAITTLKTSKSKEPTEKPITIASRCRSWGSI